MEQSEQTPKKNGFVKPGLVIVLALILGYVLFKPGNADSKPDSDAPQRPASQTRDSPSTANSGSTRERPFPTSSVETALNYNPFEFRGQRSAASRSRSAKVQTSKSSTAASRAINKPVDRNQVRQSVAKESVDIILETGDGRTARMGKRILHEGKPAIDGLNVRRILPDRVDLEFRPGTRAAKSP